jgi:integrase/recombinase XerD
MELSMSKTDTVSPLRQRMIEDMAARKLNPHTQRGHISSCKRFAAWLNRSPDTATADEVRRFQLHLVESGASIGNRNRIMTGVRFLFRVTLRRHDLAAEIWHLKEPQKLPPVLSPEEVKRVLAMATSLKARAMLTLAYGCGLRASEVARLRVCDIDSDQMIIRIVQSKGRKDRNVMLPPEILDLLRQCGRSGRPSATPALRGNTVGCFPVASIVTRRLRASSAGCSRTRRKPPACARRSLFIRCAIPSQPICSRTARTFG